MFHVYQACAAGMQTTEYTIFLVQFNVKSPRGVLKNELGYQERGCYFWLGHNTMKVIKKR